MLYLVFVFGLIFGSFLNVVIYRLNPALKLKGGVFGRSMCPNCKTTLAWYDLIPVFSFLWLKGRCRYCNEKISWQYPIVEILSGLIWVGIFYKIYSRASLLEQAYAGQGLQFLNLNLLNFFYYILILSALLVIAIYDFKWKIIPNKIVYPAIAAALIFNLFDIFKYLNLEILKSLNLEILKSLNFTPFILSLFVASIAFLFFFLIYFFSKGRAMGLGDAKLALLIGLFLSPLSAVLAFTLAFILGAVFGIILIGLGQIFPHYKKWGMKSQIAFGPFLALGAFLAFFFSGFIIKFINF